VKKPQARIASAWERREQRPGRPAPPRRGIDAGFFQDPPYGRGRDPYPPARPVPRGSGGSPSAGILAGQHDVPVISVSYGDGRASQQISLRRQEILDAADIRALAPGSALLLATGTRPALISLRPWYSGPQAPQITAAIGQAEAGMQRAALDDRTGAWPAAPFQHREEFPS
jgi:hypothetical protein